MVTLSYTVINDLDPTAPVLFLAPALGTTRSMWAGAAYALADEFRVVALDLPGHGASPRATDFTIENIADAVVEVADELGAATFSFAGVSISGAVALALALRVPDRLTAVAALCTSDYMGGAERWDARIAEVRADGTRSLIPDTADRWFAAGFLDEDIASGPIVLEMLAGTDDENYVEACKALAQYDLRGALERISVPMLFLAGSQDMGNDPASMKALHEQVEGSSFGVIPDSAHLPMVEHPELVADRLLEFFGSDR